MKYCIAMVAFALVVFTLGACSRQAPDAVAKGKVFDLGVVEVVDGIEIRHELGKDKVCTILPTVQKDGTIVLAMRVEESGKLVQQMRVTTKSDVPFQMTAGDVSIGMNPRIKL